MLLRKYFTRPALTTDVIVGFPGETQEEFAQSKAFIDKVNFYETHVFKYSKREGTKKQEAYEDALLGTVQEVLMEEEILVGGERYLTGHTREYVKVGQKLGENRINELVNVEIESRLQIIH